MSIIDLTGHKFGRWEAVKLSEKGTKAKWLCKCSCGTQRNVLQVNLKNGKTRSCGCLALEGKKKHMDLTGVEFGQLTVIGKRKKEGIKYKWLCNCSCGEKKFILQESLMSGKSKSCGCLSIKSQETHGLSKTRAYKIWQGMKNRCSNISCDSFKRYGGRGIKFQKSWTKFENFFYDMGDPENDELTLDRIDNDGDYCKENCRWASRRTQSNNTRRNRFLTFLNKRMTISEWAIETGINKRTIVDRVNRGWSVEKALTTKPHFRRNKKETV